MYTEKNFKIPELKGISQQTVEEHLKLYSGYVKNTNKILEALENKDDHDDYALAEMQRRLSFEWNGMRNHEYYFASFEGGPKPLSETSELSQAIAQEWGSFENWLERFKTLAKTRGVGWAILYYDKNNDKLVSGWVDEQHIGHLNGAQYVVGIDMWEHSFVADYQPSGKGQYIDDYFENINWESAEENFKQAKK